MRSRHHVGLAGGFLAAAAAPRAVLAALLALVATPTAAQAQTVNITGYPVATGYPREPAGSNIGRLRDPFGIHGDMTGPKGLVAATRMIPYAFGKGIGISADGKYLYGSYTGHGAVMAFDVEALTSLVETSLKVHSGDRLLTDIANHVRTHLRKEIDIPFRYGGDELFVIMPETNQQMAGTIGTRLKESIKELSHGDVTASVGIVEISPGSSLGPGEVLHRADIAMYEAKRAGGDQIACGAVYDDRWLECRGGAAGGEAP